MTTIDLFAFYFSLGGFLTGTFFGSWYVCCTIGWILWIIIKSGAYVYFTIPTPSLSAPYINNTLDFQYPLIYTLFALAGSYLVKFALQTNCKYPSEGPLERIRSAMSYATALIVYLLFFAGFWFYPNLSYPLNYLIPCVYITVILVLYYYVCKRNIVARQEHVEKHRIECDAHTLTDGRTVQEKYIFVLYMWMGVVIICLGQFFQLLTILVPRQEIYAQYLVLLVLSMFVLYVSYMVRVNPLQVINDLTKVVETLEGNGYRSVCPQDVEDPEVCNENYDDDECDEGADMCQDYDDDDDGVEVVIEMSTGATKITQSSNTKSGPMGVTPKKRRNRK